jgi:DNA (cytosine-5)-methyltransferase 1
MTGRMNGLDLFSGIAGISLALEPWVRTVAYCEQDRYAQAVLLSRMAEGRIDVAPIWDDVKTLSGNMLPPIDIIFGGFPCQDISVAGAQKGIQAERSGLFFEIMRLAEEIKPTFIFLENVPAIRTKGLSMVVRELASLRYDCRWGMLSAFDVGAPHKRQRWFLLANSSSERFSRPGKYINAGNTATDESRKTIDAQHGGKQRKWATEPNVGRVANGVPNRVDRIKCLGNACIPAQAREAFQRLMGLQ